MMKLIDYLVLIVILVLLVLFSFIGYKKWYPVKQPIQQPTNLSDTCTNYPQPSVENCAEMCLKMKNFEQISNLTYKFSLVRVQIDAYYKQNPLGPDYGATGTSKDLLSDAIIYIADLDYFTKTHKDGAKNVQKFIMMVNEFASAMEKNQAPLVSPVDEKK